MKPPFLSGLFVLFLASQLFAPLAFGQRVLDKTTYGQSQNDVRDLRNSLVPAPKRYDKGEKKEEVDPKNLPSKTLKDPTFQGSLMNLGLDTTMEAKLHDQKSRAAGESDANTSKSSGSADKESKTTKSSEMTAEAKEQRSTSSKSDEKSPEKQPDKQKVSESGGDR